MLATRARSFGIAQIFGDILCARMRKRGVAALVTDGVVRDIEGVLKVLVQFGCIRLLRSSF
jgi:regulator of RNase E activity RraA